MSLLFRVVFAAATKNTHHRLALDALRHLQHPDAERWRNLFLYHYEPYLKGSKAPDDEFKDFQNHVLHVQDNYWGGAAKTAQLWYKLTVDALRNADWKEAVYSAGVLSHYFSDPFMPLHTGQTEAEGKIHRAAEWSIAQSYVELRNIIEQDLGGYPSMELPTTPTWLTDVIRLGAEEANRHYDTLLEHYNLAAGVKNPPLGLDQELKDCIAAQIALAVSGLARVLDRAFTEAKAEPPAVDLTVETLLSTSIVPIFWITKKLADVKDRAAVEAIYAEVQARGKAVQTLPDDERAVRKLHAEQVLKKPLRELDAQKAQPTGAKHGQGTAPRVRSNRDRILQLPSLVPSSWHMPSVGLPKIKMPSLNFSSLKLTNMKVPGLSVSNLKMPKLKLPSTSGMKLPKWMRRGEQGTVEVAEAVDVEATDAANTARRTAVDPTERRGRTDLDAARAAAAASASSTSAIRRTDPPTNSGPRPADARRESAVNAKFHLGLNDPIVDAPTIGPKTARRLEGVGLKTVRDLLDCDPAATARKLDTYHIDAAAIRLWQQQAEFACRVPHLRGHDTQILTAVGVTDIDTLAQLSPDDLLDDIENYLDTAEGERLLRGNPRPDRDEVADWIQWAAEARPLQSAAARVS